MQIVKPLPLSKRKRHAFENNSPLCFEPCSGLEQEDAALCGRLFLEKYVMLHTAAKERDWMLFKLRPKLHALDHLIDSIGITGFNPMRHSCFQDEDFLGKFKRTSVRCHGMSVQKRNLERYLPLLHLRAQTREKLQRWVL